MSRHLRQGQPIGPSRLPKPTRQTNGTLPYEEEPPAPGGPRKLIGCASVLPDCFSRCTGVPVWTLERLGVGSKGHTGSFPTWSRDPCTVGGAISTTELPELCAGVWGEARESGESNSLSSSAGRGPGQQHLNGALHDERQTPPTSGDPHFTLGSLSRLSSSCDEIWQISVWEGCSL